MIKKKILSTIAAISLLSSVCVGFVPAYAAATETEPISIEYVDTGVATSKQVNFYYVGDDLTSNGIVAFELKLKLSCSMNKDALSLTAPTYAVGEFDGDYYINTDILATKNEFSVVGLVDQCEVVKTSDNLLATVEITVPEGAEDFDLSVLLGSYVTNIDFEDAELEEAITITIPGAKPADETVAATSVGTFNEWTEEAAVAAFTATLTAEQAAKTVTWNVTDGTTTKTQATTVDTTISGENDVVIGLMVKNAVAGLSASVVVK
jgi:hypothetical protein